MFGQFSAVAARALVAIAAIAVPIAAYAGCTLYQHRDYGGASWRLGHFERMKMERGRSLGCTTNDHGDGCESVTYKPSWNDHVSSFRVTRGCRLTLWKKHNQGGARFASSKSFRYVGSAWNDEASEALCRC